ncbi:AraC family transcriptional regulator [Cytophagaceae bacterium DM2B3-1]|uniref:AraC family transcriptional regulator n=1 Tax=Xanthocytophaga flava TaxID=3048013 RepID=A0ABT7D032_9BACT|nr:AraC family transcriptional regulator [Xanthocytophaga flavus]MDJ1498144.1 AraC family transcriptional regulator [Xanthocytophaga flavus]
MEEDTPQTVPTILVRFAHLLGTEIKNRRLQIPENFGTGYCAGFVFNENIQMIISNYELHEDVLIKNPDVNVARKTLFFKFQNIFPKSEIVSAEKYSLETPSVLIATSRLHTDDVISIHTNTATINIEIEASYLDGLFDLSDRSPILQSLLQNSQPLLFEQLLYPSLQKIVEEILSQSISKTFELFFLKIKAEELICRLLMELEKRNEKQLYALNSRDVQIIYKVKEQILERLETPPIIHELALFANMSPTKLKRLFKQIFGNSIFSYYQEFRMKEAARLLKEKKLAVSDVGYQLGFTNLSHFSRVFKEHIGMKPKQYSNS